MSSKRQREVGDGGGSNAKRIRSNNGSPAPASKSTQAANGGDGAKSQIAARMAALKAKLAAAKGNASTDGSPAESRAASSAQKDADGVEAKRAEAQRKIAEMKARISAQKGQSSEASAPSERPQSDIQLRIAEARAKAAEYAKQHAKPASNTTAQIVSQRTEGVGARGGLGIGLHPSLLATQESVSKAKGKSQGPKFSTTKGNRAPSPAQVNPYLAASEETEQVDAGLEGIDPKLSRRARERKNKVLSFAPKGKYIAQAAALKQQAKLEEMKRRLALEAKKTAIEEASDKSFLVPAPPDIEWWDESLLPAEQQTYDEWESHNRIESEDSVITRYVQHPVLIAAPQEKLMPAPKPMMLTKQEMKKLRRQRRGADRKEAQARVRLGIDQPEPAKVKKSNMMRVYGEQAISDPTAVEARVNREIAQRAANHEQANEERKLTKEERAEKLKTQQADDAAKGLKIAVFRVDNLSSGQHRYKVDVNAKQNSLTGIVILHPAMNLVVVEGGVHSITNYKKLMLNRIKWSENTYPTSNNSNPTFTAAALRDSNRDIAEGPSAVDTWLNPLTERGELKDLSENKCLLVWEGDERQRMFRKWGSRVCETDGEARDTLGRSKMENMWALAKGTTA